MKKWIASVVVGMSVLAGPALAQGNAGSEAAKPAAQQAQSQQPQQPQAATGLPNVQSADILNLNQNQAERTRDQPGNLAPTWRQVKEGTPNYASLPGKETSILIQPKAQFPFQGRATTAGEAWRQYRNGPLTNIGGWLLVLAVIGMAVVYMIFGQSRLKEPKTGRLIQRFTPIERMTHWTVAICFVTLGITGLIMLFGKHVLLPLFGYTLFGWLGYACKNIHNFIGPLFTVSVLVMFVLFVKDNFPRLFDFKWIVRMGNAPSGRFNGGEKLWFWGGVVVLGLVVSASGFVLDHLMPGIDFTRGVMQVANVIHLIAAVLIVAASLGHIYMGTVGMEGAYAAMRTGYVDDTWAKEHHDLWFDDIQSGKVARVRAPEDHVPPADPIKA